jgi:dTDP-4-amino-4,6-dideoxygalactose transaminase/2-polyprenyl-3-methyl-5-hydroxy-6-metoxy-1,4-benzoquinol methylase
MRRLIPPVKAIFSYRALFRSLWSFDWETEWREHFGAHSVSGHASAASALRAVFKELRNHEGERLEVVLPAYCRPMLIDAIRQAGLTPTLVDMEPMAPLVSVAALRMAINENTLAVITTNLFGAVDPVAEISTICKENSAFLIEDVSVALGCDANGKELGLFGDVVLLGLGADDVISTVDGAIVCWRNPALSASSVTNQKLAGFRWRTFLTQLSHPFRTKSAQYARSKLTAPPAQGGTEVNELGKSEPWTLQQARLSALLLPQVEDEGFDRRHLCQIIKRYQSAFGYDLVNRETDPKLTQYPCLAASKEHREEILNRLDQIGIIGGRGFTDLAKIFDSSQLPNSATLVARLYTLPCHPGLSEEDANRMLSQINQSHNAITALVKDHYSILVENNGARPKANGYSRLAFRLREKLIADQLRQLPGGDISVLDSGCGNGALGPVFRKSLKVACLDGVDFVTKSLEIAKAKLGYSRTYLANVVSIDAAIEEKQYDLVNSCDVIPYIPPEKYSHFFRSHRRCVSDGRHFLLSLPNLQSVYKLLLNSNSTLRYNYSLDEVLTAVTDAGFRPVSITGSDLLGASRLNLGVNLKPSVRRYFSCEISILCEAC